MPTMLDYRGDSAAQSVLADRKKKEADEEVQRQARAAALAQQTAINPHQLVQERDAAEKAKAAALARTMRSDFATSVQDPDLAGKQYNELDVDYRRLHGDAYGPAAAEAATAWNSAQTAQTGMIPGLELAGATQDETGVRKSYAPPQPVAASPITAEKVVAAGIDPGSLPPEQWAAAVAKRNSDAAKTIPASSVEKLNAYQEIADLSEKMGAQIAALKDTDIGPLDAGLVPTVKNFMGVSPEKGPAANSPGYNDAISTYNTVRNIILRARSGGAVTPGEADRLMGELGDPIKKPGTFKSDIANFVKNRKFDIDAQRKSLESAGYRVPAVEPKSPAAGSAGQPASPTPAQPSGQPPISTVTTREQFDALPSGATYIGKNGQHFRKP